MNVEDRRARRRRPPRRSAAKRAIAGATGGLVVFLLGVALGQALAENETDGGTVTYRRPISVQPVQPTITVTVTVP